MTDNQIELAHKDDLKQIHKLLSYYDLVIQDIDLNKQLFIKLTDNNELIAIGAMEFYKPYALLRSVAVSPSRLSSGLARKIYTNLEQKAQSNNISNLYLLTETAQGYFTKLGFENINRNLVPDQIKQTNQFNSLCPANAAVMTKCLLFQNNP